MMRFAAPKRRTGPWRRLNTTGVTIAYQMHDRRLDLCYVSQVEASHSVQTWKQRAPSLFELGVISEAQAPLRRFGDAIAVTGCGADRLHRSREFRIVCTDAGAARDKHQRNQRQQFHHTLLPFPPVPAQRCRGAPGPASRWMQ